MCCGNGNHDDRASQGVRLSALAPARRPAAVAAAVRPAGARTAARLLVFIPPRRSWQGGGRAVFSTATPVAYLALDAQGQAAAGQAPIGALPKARSVDLVLDALDVFAATIEAPALGDARLRQALPNLLEEQMLADPAECHFAAAPATGVPAAEAGAVRLSVAAIERAALARVLETCAQAQLPVRAAYSELYTVPAPLDHVFCMRAGAARAMVRTGRDQSFLVELDDSGGATLALAVHQFGMRRLRVFGAPSDAVAAVVQAAGIEAVYAAAAVETGTLDDAVNLLQGRFDPGGNFGFSGHLLSRLLRNGAWRAPAAWLGDCMAIGIGGLNLYWLQQQTRMADLRASMHRSFRDGFPNESDAYPLEQARRSVAALRARAGRPSADDFSVLNAQALQLLAAAPAGIVAGIDYADNTYRLHFKPGTIDDPALRNTLQSRAIAQNLNLRFDADGSARLAPRQD